MMVILPGVGVVGPEHEHRRALDGVFDCVHIGVFVGKYRPALGINGGDDAAIDGQRHDAILHAADLRVHGAQRFAGHVLHAQRRAEYLRAGVPGVRQGFVLGQDGEGGPTSLVLPGVQCDGFCHGATEAGDQEHQGQGDRQDSFHVELPPFLYFFSSSI